MNDMSSVIVPKSDQINADDLIAGPITVTITRVEIKGGQEQPVSIYMEGTDKAFRPCKSMSRVLVAVWGADAGKYVGRSMTLYRDATVKWGGMEVGGIRISHMTHMDKAQVLALTATKGSRKPYTIKPLVVEQQRQEPADDQAFVWANKYIVAIGERTDRAALAELQEAQAKKFADLRAKRPDQADRVQAAIDHKLATLANDGTLSPDNPAATEGRDDVDVGERDTLEYQS